MTTSMQFKSDAAWKQLTTKGFVFTLRPEDMAKRTVSKVRAYHEPGDPDAPTELGRQETSVMARKVKVAFPVRFGRIGAPGHWEPSISQAEAGILLVYVKWSGFRSVGDWLRTGVNMYKDPRRAFPTTWALYYVHLL